MAQQSHEAALRSVIEASFDAALDAGRWSELLRRLTVAGGGIGSLFVGVSFSEPERGFLVVNGLDDALSHRFMTVHQDNLWSRRLMHVPPGGVVDVQAGHDPAELHATQFYQEIVAPQDVGTVACLPLVMGDGIATGGVSIALPNGRSGDQSLSLLRRVAPYLQRAATTAVRLRQNLRAPDALPVALDAIAAAVFLTDAQAQLLQANRRGERLLAAGDGLRCAGKQLAAARHDDTRALHALVAETALARTDRLPPGGGALAIARPSGRRALALLAAPVRDPRERWALPTGAAVLLTVADPEDRDTPGTRAVAAARIVFGLTTSEAQVALQIACGLGLPETAQRLGIGTGTVRAHLKQVYAKTGVHRQSSLVRLFSRCGLLDLDAAG